MVNGTLLPVFFEGPTAAEILEDLLCGCRGRRQCEENCSCSKNKMGCTDQCACGGADNCNNTNNNDGNDETE